MPLELDHKFSPLYKFFVILSFLFFVLFALFESLIFGKKNILKYRDLNLMKCPLIAEVS